MPRPKIDRLLLVLIPIILPVLLLSSPAYAETKTFVEEYTYQESEADSKISSRAIALEQVKRLLLEKLGTYLESKTEVRNFKLKKDQIVILTAGIVRAEIIEERRARQPVGAEMRIDIEVFKEIARTNNGKVRAVVREI